MAVLFQQDFNNALQQPQGLIGQAWRKDLLQNLSDDESLSAAQELYKAITGLTTQEEIEQTASEWLNRCIQGVCERALKSLESNVNDWIGEQIKNKEWAGVSYKEWEDRETELREQGDSNQGYHEEVNNLKASIRTLKDKIQAQAKEIHEQKEEHEMTRRDHADELRDLKKSHETENAIHQKEIDTAMEQLDQKDVEINSERAKLEKVKLDKAEYERAYDTVEDEIRAAKDERDRAKEEMKQAQDAADKLQPVLEREQTQRKEVEQELEAERKSHEDLKEEIQEAKTRINELERRARRSTSPTESSSESTGGPALSDELNGMSMSSPSTSPTDTSPAASDAGGSREERLRRDYVMPILRQVANHRELKDFEPFEEPVETVDNENKLLATLGALVSHYGYNHVENEDGTVFEFPFGGLQQWLEGKERAAGGAGSERPVADTVTTIQSSFEGELAHLRGLKAQKADKLDKEINDLKNLNSKLTADQSASEEELKKLRDAQSQAQGQDTDKTNQINDLTQKIAKLNEQQESSSEELKKLQDSRDELGNQYKVASQHLDGLKRLNSDLITKIKSQEDGEKKKNEDGQKKQQQQVEALEKEIAELNEKDQKASDAFKALQNTHDELKKQSEGAINDLKNQLSESESQQISELQKQLAELQKALEQAEEDFGELMSDNSRLERENDDKAQENFDLMERYEGEAVQLSSVRHENNDRKKQLEELGTQLADLTAKEESLTKDFNDLKKKHDDLLLRYANVKAENMSKTDEIEDLQKQLEQVNARQKSLDQELEDLKGNHDQISGDSDAKDKKIEELESTVRRITNNSKKDWVALSRLQHQLNDHKDEARLKGSAYAQLHEEWKEATALLEEEISDLKKKAETGGNFDDWYQATSILRKEISELKRKQDETAASYNALKASQQKLEDKNKEHVEKLQEEIAQLKRENNQHIYGPEITEMQRQMSAKAIKELKGQAKKMEDEIGSLRTTRYILQQRVKARETRLKEEEDKVKTLENTNQELIKKNEKLQAEAEDNEELQESRNQLKEAQLALDRVKRKEAQLQDELRKNQEQLKEQELLEQTGDQLREALRKSEELLKEKEQLIEKQKQNKSATSDANAAARQKTIDEALAEVDRVRRLAAELQQHLSNQKPVDPDMAARVEIGRLLLRYYRAMQAAIATYKTEKRRMIDEGLALSPGFLEDMDVSLQADRRRLQERLDAARTDAAAVAGPPSDDAPKQQIAILERELEKYGGIINEINAGNTLANEAFEISAVFELSPHAAEAERLFDERQKTRAETETEPSPGTALTEPRGRGGADALAETCCYCFPCTPCDWLVWVLVASIAFFIFAFVSQQRQKAEWSEANALSRSLYIVDRNYNNPTAWWQIAIFILLNIKAFYLK